jgi:hypothetical protein
MHIINVNGFKEYMKRNQAAFDAENEIIKEKLLQGIDGLEWLVLNTNVDETKASSFNSFVKCCKALGKDIEDIFKDALTMDNETFYEKHEINWWIAVDDGLTYLTLLKEKDYDKYFTYLQSIYREAR